MMKRLLSLVLCIAMLTSMLTVTAVADTPDPYGFLGYVEFDRVWNPKRSWSNTEGIYDTATNSPYSGDAKAIGQWQYVFQLGYAKTAVGGVEVDDLVDDDFANNSGNYYYKFTKNDSTPPKITIELFHKGPNPDATNDDELKVTLTEKAVLKAYGDNCYVLAAEKDRGYFISLKTDANYSLDGDEAFQIEDIIDPVKYTITYSGLDGSTVAANPKKYTIKDTFTLNNPEKKGYEFLGWTGSNGDTPETTVTIPLNTYGPREYIANWSPKDYTITYHLNGGATTNPGTYTIEEAADIILTDATKAGYEFLGWTGEGVTTPTKNITIAAGSTENREYTANWSDPIVYGITYNLNGGTASNPTSYNVETPTFTLNNPAKNHYVFAGWTGSNGTEKQLNVSVAQDSTGNKSYTANWTPFNYSITYDLAGGAANNPATYTYESDPITLNAPTRAGYSFTGWTGSNGTEKQLTVTIAAGSSGAKSYTATWSDPIVYGITYNLNGGTASNPTSYNVETATFTLNNPSKEHYTFAGWTGSNGTEKQLNVSVAQGSTGNKSYTANWTAEPYTITYNLNGGALAEENPTGYNVESAAITLNNPTREGYTFAGWTGTGLTEATETVTIANGSFGDRSYTATWTPIEYTITYTLGTGASANNPATYTIESNDIILNNPTREGYTFAGWTGSNGTTAAPDITITKGSTGNKSYTANWTAEPYTITYNLNGGALAEENPTGYNVESAAITLNNPTREGYTFAGWTGTGLTGATQTVTIAKGSFGDRTYTANWAIVDYTISYELNGGAANNPATYTIETDTFTLNNPAKNHYEFAGWTGSNGTEKQLNVSVAQGSTGNKSYTANWTPFNYSITYDLAGGAVSAENPAKYNIESATFVLGNPTKTGYIFTGWTGSNGDTPAVTVAVEKGSAGHKTYTANWTPANYDITYDLAGGAVATENPGGYNIETATFTLNNPTKKGYTFTGWTGSNGDTPETEVSVAVGSYGDKAYTANWEIIDYSIAYNLDEGTLAEANPATYTIETATFTLNNPAKKGYTFDGWTGSNGTTPETEVIIEKGSIDDKTYTANWTINDYTLTYNLGGGTATNPTTYTVETATFTLNNPTRSGYTFDGWTGSNGTTAETEVTVEAGTIGNKTYTANWTPIEYTVSYDLAGGTVATANPAVYNIETATFTLTNPTRGGYTFDGWTGSNGDTPETEVTVEAGTIGNKTYTANWTPIVYTITYTLGEDGTTSNPIEYTVESDPIPLAAPTRWGYVFEGWTGNGITTPTMDVTIDAGSIGNKAYTANWSPSDMPEVLYPGESYVLRTGLDRHTYKVSGFDFTNGRKDYNGISYIESITINKNGDLVLTLKENFDLALETARVLRGEITVVDKTTFPREKYPVFVDAAVNNEVNDVYGSKKIADAEDINGEWAKNTVIVMDDEGGYVTFSKEALSGTVKMKKDEKTYLNLVYGRTSATLLTPNTEDTIDAIEEYLGEDYVDDAIIEYYTFETRAFKNEVDFSYDAYEDDPHFFYLWKNGKLTKIDATYNADEDVEAWQWTADAEGTIIVTDVEIVLSAEKTKNPNTGR